MKTGATGAGKHRHRLFRRLPHYPGADRGNRRKLSQQINQIIHHDDFQKLEGAQHGLHYLVNNSETDEMLKIRFMSISKQELGRTLKRYKGVGWDQSPIFKKIYEEEYGQFGGEPFGCGGRLLLRSQPAGRGAAGRNGQDRRRLALPVHRRHRAERDADGVWQELSNPRDLTKIFQNTEYAAAQPARVGRRTLRAR